MSGIKLLLCEEDIAYTQALVGYLMGSRKGMELSITTYHDPEGLSKEDGFFNIGILGKSFLNVDVKCHLQRQFILGEERKSEEESEYLFKYQNMDSFMGKVFKMSSVTNEGQELVVVYSPVFHELRLPFCLCLCRMFSEAGDVLFIDLEQVSILNRLMGKETNRDLLDYLYMMESKRGCDDLSSFLDYCEGFAFLPPMSSPFELSDIIKDQWETFLKHIEKSGFKKVVLLMDTMLQGTLEFFEKSDEIVLLGRPGGLNITGMELFKSLLEKRGLIEKTREVILPLLAGESTDVSHTPESIFQGNLMRFVREELGVANGRKS